MAMYTKQGYVKGSYEAYQWLINNTQHIDERWEKNPVTLFFKGHSLVNACQDAMDPYTFAKEMKACEEKKDWDTGKLVRAPVWYRGEYLRERIVWYMTAIENERDRMIDQLKSKEEQALREEPMKSRQIVAENSRWADYPQEYIDAMTTFLPNNAYPDFQTHVKMPVVLKATTENGYYVYVFEKLSGYYMGIMFNPHEITEGGFRPLKYSYSVLCEEAAQLVARHAPNLPRVKTPQVDISNVQSAMGLNSESYPDDLKQNKLF